MSQTKFPLISYPLGTKSVSTTSATLDAAGEEVHFVGQISLQNGSSGGSKTISSAGGKIHLRFGTTTFANAGTTVRVGLGAVSTTLNPPALSGSPAATPDVYDDLVGATDTITSSTIKTITMSTGTKTISHGDFVAISINMSARGGADSVVVSFSLPLENATTPMPVTSTYIASTWARVSGVGSAVIEFDDGTFGWLDSSLELTPIYSSNSLVSVSHNVSTGTADEYGNLIRFPVACGVHGARFYYAPTSASADYEIILYSNPLGTPVAERTATVDATMLGITTGICTIMFSSPFVVTASTDYAITIRPTTANSITTSALDHEPVSVLKASGTDNTDCYAVRRLDNTGAFSDYNGGTAKSRRMLLSAVISTIPDDRSAAQSQIGLY